MNSLTELRVRWGASRLVPSLVVAGYAAFVVAWALGSPLNTGPDESQHFNRALALGHGEVSGSAIRPARPDQLRLYWITLTTRAFTSPGLLAEREVSPCEAFRPTRPAACPPPPAATARPVRSYTGSYQPFVLLPVGLVADSAHSEASGFWRARLTGAVICLMLLGLAAGAALAVGPDERLPMLAGLVVALPPMALFMFSVVNPNSSEIAAGLCFAAGLVRLMRNPRSTVAWVALAVGGVILGAARSLGPFWLAFGLLVLLADMGVRGVARLPRRWAIGSAAALGVAALACAWWEATRQPHLPITVHDTVHNLPTALNEWVMLLRQSVGVFGWNDTRMPALVYVLGWLIAGGLGVGALIVGSPRERATLTGAAVALLFAGVLISAAVLHKEGFAMQARYMLPPAALLPIYAAEILRRHSERLPKSSRHLLLATVLFAAMMQVIAWLTNARRYAVGSHGPINFFGHSLWRPADGWVPFALLVAAAAVLLAAAGVLAHGRRPAGAPPESTRESNNLVITAAGIPEPRSRQLGE